MEVCYICCGKDCQKDCFFNVGGHCKYGEVETENEVPQCNPAECYCQTTLGEYQY